MSEKLVYIGRIIALDPIEKADFIDSATVVCGVGGKWRGIVKKDVFQVGDLCNVFLPDSIVPEQEAFSFMKASGWRVKMRRFRNAPSEVLIMENTVLGAWAIVGRDITAHTGVTKYYKPVPQHLQGYSIGTFPSFMPKTDEPNYQGVPDMVDALVDKRYFITEKADGSSTTAYRYKGNFGVCSRNLELERNEDNGYWKMAIKHKLEINLPEGIALQWETCGPGIQSNPMNLPEISAFAFSAYNILEHKYLEFTEFYKLCQDLKFPTCKFLSMGPRFSKQGIELLGEGKYQGGGQREGVVVRSQENIGFAPISFKVINLNFDK